MGRLPASEQTVQPGEYTWTGFEPAIVLVIDQPIWMVGHRHEEFFDLFPAGAEPGSGPGIGFGRFDDVHGADGAVPMADAVAVVAALRSNDQVELEELGATSLAGLTGLAVDVRVADEQTPLFDGIGGTFHMDPGWVARYHFLDVDGDGVLLVSVQAHDGEQEAGLVLAEPVLAGLRLAD